MRTPLYRPRPGSIPTLGVPSLDGVKSVHLIGVGGAGMRNLARLFLAKGIRVSGSDLKDSEGCGSSRPRALVSTWVTMPTPWTLPTSW